MTPKTEFVARFTKVDREEIHNNAYQKRKIKKIKNILRTCKALRTPLLAVECWD